MLMVMLMNRDLEEAVAKKGFTKGFLGDNGDVGAWP
jgi:hypothetical protein